MRIARLALAVSAITAICVSPARLPADVLLLSGGGRVEGDLLNPGQSPRQNYQIKLAGGGRVTIAADQVQEHQPQRPKEQEYERIKPRYADTVAGQWALAEWCREQQLFAQRDAHLERIIELDPNHADARRALGYSKVEGKWARQDELMAERGMVRYKGRYRTRQEVELMEAKRTAELAEKEWFQKVDRWKSWLATDRGEMARQSLTTINDPVAIKALAHGLRHDNSPAVRTVFAEALANFNTGDATRALALCALEDEIEEVRLTALDYLAKKPHPDAVSYFATHLRSKDNIIVNRAGKALGKMKDPSAVRPLIDALVTVHKYKVKTGDGNMSTTFGSGGGGGLSMGNPIKIVSQAKPNPDVLDALVALTGQNFSYEERSWKAWLATQKRHETTFDSRRD